MKMEVYYGSKEYIEVKGGGKYIHNTYDIFPHISLGVSIYVQHQSPVQLVILFVNRLAPGFVTRIIIKNPAYGR